jgi:predicted dehydrogenase
MLTGWKFGDDPQEAKAIASPGQAAVESDGMEDQSTWGTLTTTTEFDPESQKLDGSCQKYIGKYPSLPGYYKGYYENIVDAVRGKGKVNVDPQTARDGIRIMEMARESHAKGATIPWS